MTKPSVRISTKILLHKLYKTSAAKCWTNSSFKVLPELQLQNLDQTLCSKSKQNFSFMTKLQFPNLHQTIVNTFLNINISNNSEILKYWGRLTAYKCLKLQATLDVCWILVGREEALFELLTSLAHTVLSENSYMWGKCHAH